MKSKAGTKKTPKKKKRKSQRKPQFKFSNKSVAKFFILVIILLAVLLLAEGAQIFLQVKSLAKKVSNNPRPVYIVDSQPIDLDAYLREYFANQLPKKTMYVTVSAYSSTNGQTDDTPFVTAIGTPVRDGIVAANFLPIGTVIRFPDKFENKLFLVEDRMNERFGLQVDIWMSEKEEAKEFGIQYLKIEVF